MKRLRDVLTIAALGMIIGASYAFMQKADADAADREQAVTTGTADK